MQALPLPNAQAISTGLSEPFAPRFEMPSCDTSAMAIRLRCGEKVGLCGSNLMTFRLHLKNPYEQTRGSAAMNTERSIETGSRAAFETSIVNRVAPIIARSGSAPGGSRPRSAGGKS